MLTAATAGFGADASAPVVPAVAGGPAPKAARNARFSVGDPPNSYDDITSYNNFYEFGLDKEDPKANSQKFRSRPWTVEIGGVRGAGSRQP